ncbi:MAG: hypothetical protein K1W30_21740 [Lachnospiraceae bacterium]
MKKKSKKMKNLITTTSLCILLCSGCSPTQQAPVTPEISVDLSEKRPVNQPDADITIPSILIGEELSQIQADNTPVDNGDGTVTYSLKGGELDSILQQIADSLSDSIQDILDNDDYYPNITEITHDADYTSFTISLSDGQMSMYESMLVMSFYTIGNRYQIYSGVPADQAVTTVIYVNDADNSVISRTDSTSVETFSP